MMMSDSGGLPSCPWWVLQGLYRPKKPGVRPWNIAVPFGLSVHSAQAPWPGRCWYDLWARAV